MRVIAIINQKGGCGKTTTAINLAACLAGLGESTLLVDLDPQGHCAVGLAVPEDQIQRTILDTLVDPGPNSGDAPITKITDVTWQIAENFDLAPATLKLAAFEQLFAGKPGRESRLSCALAPVGFKYNYAILDCPPSVGLITFNALMAADEVIVPVETGFFSLHGLSKMLQTLAAMKTQAGKDIPVKILPTLYDTRTKLAREVLADLKQKFPNELMTSTVNFNTKLKEAASFGQPITEYDPGSRGYKDFLALARELMGGSPPRPLALPELTPSAPTSRPAELVQRAKALANLTNIQFGRNLVPMAHPLSKGDADQSSKPNSQPSVQPKPSPAPQNGHTNGHTNGHATGLSEKIAAPATKLADPAPHTNVLTEARTAARDQVADKTHGPTLSAGRTSTLSTTASPAVSSPVAHAIAAAKREFEDIFSTAELDALRAEARAVVAAAKIRDEELATEKTTQKEADEARAQRAAATQAKIDAFYGIRKVETGTEIAVKMDTAGSVQIAGDFNNWSAAATPLTPERGGRWSTTLRLPSGRYRYRLVVDGQWLTDPHNQNVESNQFGELNNVVEVE